MSGIRIIQKSFCERYVFFISNEQETVMLHEKKLTENGSWRKIGRMIIPTIVLQSFNTLEDTEPGVEFLLDYTESVPDFYQMLQEPRTMVGYVASSNEISMTAKREFAQFEISKGVFYENQLGMERVIELVRAGWV